MGKIIRKTRAELNITPEETARLKRLMQRPDSEIDYSDIPPLDEKFWKNAVSNPFYRPVKKQITLRLDADVIAWLRHQGKGYQTKANALLREMMLKDISAKAS
jgi:uncharacterized protein (DUF4415 family)